MSMRTGTKLTPGVQKPKRTFRTIQVRPEVLDLLNEVEDLCEAKHQVRPKHSKAFENALNAYKEKLLAA